jgi:predicted transposase/invertase (TIGR01784 family)
MTKKTKKTSAPQKGTTSTGSLKPARFLDPKSDLVFKNIFGERKEMTISFLNGILPLDEGHLIQSIEYLPSEQVPRIPTMKNTIVDVKCTDESGRIFIVEMQFNWFSSFMKRVLFGASKAYVQQLKRGEDFESLCPVYGLAIVNENFDKSDEWFHHYKTVNIKNTNKVLPGLELFFLELQKFQPRTFEHRKMGVLWLRFLREIDEMVTDVPAEFTENPLINQALELTQESAYTPAQLEGYDRFWDAIRVEKTVAADARRAGREEGVEINRTETVKSMIREGCPLQLITNVTKFSISAIQKIKKELEKST